MPNSYIAPLLEVVHSQSTADWKRRNDAAFRTFFGSTEGRYPKAAEKTAKLRAPEMNAETGVTFAAYIHPQNPDSGAYSGLSFVIFPLETEPALFGLVVGTQGLSPDEAILGRGPV